MKTRHTRFHPLAGLLLLLAAVPAQAHHPMGGRTPETAVEGLLSGLGHPIIGLDHLAFLAVIALLAFAVQGPSRLLVPLAFVAATLAGTLVHLGALDLPLAETVIALSVLLGGALVVLRRRASALPLALAIGGFGLFHGYAYGEAIVGAEQGPVLAYLIGFAAVQYLVIVGGVKLLDLIERRSPRLQRVVSRVAGGAATLAGGLFLAASLG